MPFISGEGSGLASSGDDLLLGSLAIQPTTDETPLVVTAKSGGQANDLFEVFADAAQDGGSVTVDAAGGLEVVKHKLPSAGGHVFIFEVTGVGGDGIAVKQDSSGALELGFFNATPAAKPTVTGAKLPSDVALASLLTALSTLGLLTDSTT